MKAAINVEVVKGQNENNLSVLRRFTKRVQGSGILPKVRGKRYNDREQSPNVRRAKTISYLKKKDEIAELLRLGKQSELSKFTRRK